MEKGLHLICGGSGSGKSTFIYDNIIKESLDNPEDRYFLVVPEQATNIVERDLILRHPMNGSLNIDVLSINRLCYRVTEELNYSLKAILDDIGKSMLLRKVVYDNRADLKVYKSMGNKPGFIDQLKSVISEFYQYEVHDKDLISLVDNESIDDILKSKINDLYILYNGFVSELGENYRVTEEMPDLLAGLTLTSQLLNGAHFYFDNFTGFTPNQYTFMAELFKVAHDVTFAITLPKNAALKGKYNDIFTMSRDMRDALVSLYEPYGDVSITWLSYEGDRYRQYGKPDLLALETSLFRYKREVRTDVEVVNVKGYEAVNVRAEINAVAKDIRDYIDNHNLRYRDVAIVTADLSGYRMLIDEIFPAYSIPYYIDSNDRLVNNPYIEGLKAALDIALNGRDGFTKERIFKLLDSNVTGLDADECIDLKNYLLETGTIGSKAWNKGFTRVPKYLWCNEKDEKRKKIKEAKKGRLLEYVNELRVKLIAPLAPVIEAAGKRDTKELAKAIYEYTLELDYQKKLQEYADRFRDSDPYTYSLWSRIYSSLISLLDKFVLLTKDYTDITGDEIYEIMSAGLDEVTVGNVPATFDRVTVGELMRSRLPEIKVLFMIGLNDSVLPMDAGSTNLLNDRDREELGALDITFAPGRIDKAYQEKFYLYLMATKPSDELIISYSRMDASANSTAPCYFVRELKRVLPRFDIRVCDKEVYLCTSDNLYDVAVRRLVDYEKGELSEDELSELVTILKYSKESGLPLLDKLIKAYGYTNEVEPLSDNMIDKLFGKELSLSVSRLEQYTTCPFKHFLIYGLRLSEPDEYGFIRMDYGNLLHRILELYGRSVKEQGISYSDLDYETHLKLADDAIVAAIDELDYAFDETSRLKFQENVIRDIAYDNIDIMAWQNKRSGFEPEYFEYNFGRYEDLKVPVISLDKDRELYLRGVIDRVDRYRAGDKDYIRVIDYKTGDTKFNITKIYYGLQLQLLTYLNVLDKEVKGDIKGAYYYHVHKPLVKFKADDSVNEDELLKRKEYYNSYLKQFKLNGFCDSDRDVVAAIEHNTILDECDTVNIKFSKEGDIYKNSDVLSTDDIEDLMSYADNKIKSIAEEIYGGRIDISPYKLGNKTPCRYCGYKDVCHVSNDSCEYRNMTKKTIEDIKEGLKDE